MKLPAGTQVIDATGKWVTPGIVAGFSRLGLADVDLSAEGADDTTAQRPVQRGDRRRRPRSTRSTRPSRSTAPTASPARIVAPSAGKSIFAGQGAVIDTGADMDPITARAEVPVRRAWRDRRGQGGRIARLRARPVPQCAARGGGAAPLRAAGRRRARRGARRARPARRPQSERIARLRTGRAAQRGRAADPLRRRRAGAGAAGTAVSARPCRARERHPPGACAQARIPDAQDRAGRRERRLDWSPTGSRVPACR